MIRRTIKHFRHNGWDFVFFIVGIIILGKQTYAYLLDKQELTFPHLVVFIIGTLMIASPVFLIKKIKEFTNSKIK